MMLFALLSNTIQPLSLKFKVQLENVKSFKLTKTVISIHCG